MGIVDERYRILSGTVAGLAFQKDSDEPHVVNWRARCQTITTRLGIYTFFRPDLQF